MPSGGAGTTGDLMKPNQWGWYKRRLPIITDVPWASGGGGGSNAVALLAPLVVSPARKSQRGSVFGGRMPIAGRINIAGGVLRPWVIRSDYKRNGRVFQVRPVLKAPPPPVAGGVPAPWVVRRHYQRAGRVFAVRPPLTVPSAAVGTVWYAPDRGNVWYSLFRALIWEAPVATTLTKRSGETRQYTMDFSALPELQSASLAGVASVVSTVLTVGANNVTLTNPAVGSNGKTATITLSGGTPGATYQIAFTVNLTGGIVLEDFGYLLVEDE